MLTSLNTIRNDKLYAILAKTKLLWVPSRYTSKIPPDLGKAIAENISKNASKVTSISHTSQSPKVTSTPSPDKTPSTTPTTTPPNTPPTTPSSTPPKSKFPMDSVGNIKPVLHPKIPMLPIMDNEEYIQKSGFVKEQYLKDLYDSSSNKFNKYEEPKDASKLNATYTEKGVITSTSSLDIQDKTKSDISLNIPVPPAQPLKILTQPVNNSKNICCTEELKNKTKPVTDGQNNKPSIIQLLTQAEKMNLSKYDDAHEKGYYDIKNAAEAKLTDLGRSVFKAVKSPNNEQESIPSIEFNSDIKYEAGMLKASSETLILLAEHTHLIVVFDSKTNVYIGLGILTSQNNTETIKLADKQYSNENKIQYYRKLPNPLVIKKEDIEINEKVTAYMQNIDKIALADVTEEQLKKNPTIYDKNGVTKTDLYEMISYQKTQLQPKLKKINPNQNKNQEEKEFKAKQNQEKQILKSKQDKENKLDKNKSSDEKV